MRLMKGTEANFGKDFKKMTRIMNIVNKGGTDEY
jgi:hypothetical protein